MPTKSCVVYECLTQAKSYGYCQKHSRRLKKFGSLQLPTFEDKFWSKVDKTSSSKGCWLWTGAKTQAGYGQVGRNYKHYYTHRVAYELCVGTIPAGLELDHMCHVTHCLNPDHLRPATSKQQKENKQGLNSDNLSGYRGVCWHKGARKWVVQVGHNGKRNYGGLFEDVHEAGKVAKEIRVELHTHNDIDRK